MRKSEVSHPLEASFEVWCLFIIILGGYLASLLQLSGTRCLHHSIHKNSVQKMFCTVVDGELYVK